MRRDIDDALLGWPYDPDPGEVVAREIRARDGRALLQVRVELGVLQLETEGRPDGTKPHGFVTYLDYLRHRAASRGLAPGAKAPSWTMNGDHALEIDREFIQFYHRRVAWLALQRYEKALRDAEHTLALMDFIHRHSTDEEFLAKHDRFRGLVLFHRTQALAALSIERRKPDEAIDAVREGLEKLTVHQTTWGENHEGEEAINQPLIDQLRDIESEIRKNYAVEKTLKEQLDEAVADEDYERAARLRDIIRSRGPH
ncbi:MAG: UvrB/UvrC motif-containing protein [Isosphaeraceae bacterium]|nr:UvrB/UvrC motif-containing protein [Isosphaeraceae bacterium]